MKAETVALPPPNSKGQMALEAAIAARRSVRTFEPYDMSLEEISQLLWAAQGITGQQDFKRAAPSAGGCCPLEFYTCTEEGVYRYQPDGHRLQPHLDRDIRPALVRGSWDQRFLGTAAAVFAISAVFARTTSKYGERGQVRYVGMDVGHAAQNLLLQAVTLGLASVPVGAFDDSTIAQALSLPSEEEPLYLLTVGKAGGR